MRLPSANLHFFSLKNNINWKSAHHVGIIEDQIVSLFKSYPGSKHDFATFKEEPSPTPAVPLLADSGYQGLHHRLGFPIKPVKEVPLTDGLEKVKQILVGYQIGKSKGENVCIN